MESNHVDNAQNCPTDGAQLVRNRSLKTKLLVRSQAIRESQSPPRSLTPAIVSDISREPDETSSQLEHSYAHKDQDEGGADGAKKHSVEIQITTGCDSDPAYGPGNGQRERAARWLRHDCQLLSHPLVTCVCRCPSCSGIIRPEYNCLGKQDSGIACSDDCPDCTDCDHTGGAGDGIVKSASEDLGIDTNIYCKCPVNKDKPKNILTKSDSVEERLELSGPELISFIKATLNKSSRDRIALLKIEKELHALVNDNGRTLIRFPVMTSYGRMLVHRCASLFHLTHILDSQTKGSVLVSKQGTSGGRIPCTTFRQWCTSPLSPNHSQDTIQAKSILKRLGSGSQEGIAAPIAARTLAQRQRDYDTLRTRIFNSEEESNWPWLNGPVKLLTPDPGRNKLLKVQSLESTSEPMGRERVVSKSHSFAGYPPESQQRQLSRQGDLASSSWRLSPSSSGYKTLSLRSTDSVTPSPTGGVSPEPNPAPGLTLSDMNPGRGLNISEMNTTLAPTSGLRLSGLTPVPGLAMAEMSSMPGLALTPMASVSHTQLLLHPQTGRPLLNPDGSLYQYDPNNPPVLYGEAADVAVPQQIDQNNEKRRGRLEKQHSFIENEYETAVQESPEHSYQLSLSCDNYTHEQVHNQTEHISGPMKINFDNTVLPTNQNAAAQDLAANHGPSYDNFANNRTKSVDSSQREDKHRPDSMQYSTPIGYVHGYRPDVEIESPNQHTQLNYAQQNIHGATKTMPLQAIQDPNLRPLPMHGMVYPTHMTQGYAYNNHCGMEGGACAATMYQPGATSVDEQQKQLAQPDNTFRIDASYPYAAVEAYACGSQCVNGCTMDPTHHRNVYATPAVDPQGAVYPLTNIMIPQQYPLTQYQPLQWQPNMQPILAPLASTTPLQKPLTSPNLYLPPTEIPIYPPHIYPQGQIYPLIQYQLPYLPQTYPMCPNLYPVDQRKFDSPRNTPQIDMENKSISYDKDNKVQYQTNTEIKEGLSNDLALQIQKLNERFASLNRDDKVESQRSVRGEKFDYRKRNNGNGILGSYPASNGCNMNMNYGRPMNEDSQLTTAARAIANSIRHAQSKNQYQPNSYQRTQERQSRTEVQPQQQYQPYQQQYIYQKHDNYQKTQNNQKLENYQKPESYKAPEHFQKPDNSQKSENYQKPDSYQKSQNYQKPGSYQKPENQQKTEIPKPENCQKWDTFQKTENSQKSDNYQKPERHENTETPENSKKPESYQKPETYQKPENNQKSENFQRQDSYQNGRYRNQRQYEPERRVEDGRTVEAERNFVQRDRNFGSGRFDQARNRTGNPMMPFNYRQPYVFRQMSPNTWCRRTPPSQLNPGYTAARRPPPETRNPRR